MSHLTDRFAEFVFGELSTSEMAEAKRHLAECPDCVAKVQQFERTYAFLKASPDVDPPRSVVFVPPERRTWFPVFDWRWVSPMFAAAAMILAGLIALRPMPAPVQIAAPAPAIVQTQEVDYNRIVNELRQSERVWLASELQKRDKEIQRLQGELDYYDSLQRRVMKETWENGASIQSLAARQSGSRD